MVGSYHIIIQNSIVKYEFDIKRNITIIKGDSATGKTVLVDMVRDVDSSEVLGTGAIDSPVLGVIAPEKLSGGVKTLILIDKVDDKIFNASNCGDNCAKWLLEMGKKKDITINLRHLMKFGSGEFEIYVENENVIVNNSRDLVRIAGKYV